MAIKSKLTKLAKSSPELSRALPSSRGGETPLSLQTAHTDIRTYFTEIGGTQQLYAADRWVIVRLLLESAGPVDVGQSAKLDPVLSGKGRSLVTGVEYQTTLGKGTRLYITSQTVNRVLVTIEPIPWLSQISGQLATGFEALVAAISSLRRTKTQTAAEELPCPTPRRGHLPKLKR